LNPRKFLPQELKLLAILTAVQFSSVVDFVIMMPLGPQLTQDLHFHSIQQFTLVVGAYNFAAAFSGFIGGLYIERFERKRALLFLLAGFILGTEACALSRSFYTLLGARFLAGLFGGVLGAVATAIVGDQIPYARRGAAMGILMSSFSIALVVGVPAGLELANSWSWEVPFMVVALFATAILIAAWFLLPEMKRADAGPPSAPWATLREVFREPNHLWAFALTSIIMFAGFSLFPLLATYVQFNMGLAPQNIKYMYLIGGLITAFTGPLIGRLADRFGKHRVFFIVGFGSIAPILIVSHTGFLPTAWILVLTTCFMVLMSGRFVPAMAMITAAVKPSVRGSFMSLNSSFQQLSGAIATLVVGMIVVQSEQEPIQHYGRVGVMAAILTFCALFIGLRLRTHQDAPTTPPAPGAPTEAPAPEVAAAEM